MKYKFTFSVDNDKLINKLHNTTEVDGLLNSKLSEISYSKKIDSIFFVYQAISPENTGHHVEDFKRFRRKTKVLEMYLTLNYYKFLEADNKQAKEMMSELYLKGIEKYLIPRKDFKGKEFYHDVKELFEQHKLIKKMPENTR